MTIEIRVLGRFSVWREGVEIPAGAFHGRLVRSLVRILVTRRGRFVAASRLARVSSHSLQAALTGSRPALCHHSASLPERWRVR